VVEVEARIIKEAAESTVKGEFVIKEHGCNIGFASIEVKFVTFIHSIK
jgi:hypothetical protein